ncbi:hypothetical protein [Pseudomonas oryzihabitans]|uniref:hypothetical protein n=1 Tax=Pseudomonas oryzihabitans TaxID=47885 RepID=UPI002895BF87|nr:hypothetical protein [Pseudomonas oryzihabitans]MDT3721527.1 hypothetical protein [Pseudomonas oryzihabitans]
MSTLAIKAIIEELTTLHVVKGVQPSELVDSIFEENYLESSFQKTTKGYVFKLSFTEKEDLSDQYQVIEMRYTYNKDRHLVLIQQKIGSKRLVTQWDRQVAIEERVSKLKTLLLESKSHQSVAKILATLPCEFSEIKTQLKLVA